MTAGKGQRRSLRSGARGQAIPEFALVLPVFLLIMMGLVDFGRVIYAQNTISHDARSASRAGSVSPALSQTQYDGVIRQAARNLSPGVSMAGSAIKGASGACATSPDATAPGYCFYPDGVTIDQYHPTPRVVVNIHLTVPLLTPVISHIWSSFSVDAQSITYIQ